MSDQNKKDTDYDENLPQDTNSDIDKSNENETGEEITDELENLKDLFQGEIDKLLDSPDAPDWKALVDDARQEAHDNSMGIPPGELCENCNERRRDISVSETNPYCSSCRELMKKYPFNFSDFVIPVIAAVLIGFSMFGFFKDFSLFKSVSQAQKLASDKKLYSAVTMYEEIADQISSNGGTQGKRLLLNQAQLFDEIGADYYEHLEMFIEKHRFSLNPDSFFNASVRKKLDKIKEYNKIYNLIYPLYSDSSDYKDFVKKADKAVKGLNDGKYDKGVFEYFKYYASVLYNEKEDIQLKHLKNMERLSPQYYSIYLPSITETYMYLGDYDNMFKYCDIMESKNKENLYAFLYRSVGYRIRGDITKSLKSANDGLLINPDDSNLNRQAAIAHLLQGQPQIALGYAQKAYDYADSLPVFIQGANLYALCCHITGDEDTYSEIEDALADEQQSVSEDVINFIEGKMSLQDIFQKGDGDIKWT
ncbi:MAG: hypothetical protein LBH71_04620 [Oscillospiraceae bacterium]|nr:hypothetical protein [Oscillospiraceae bacterium]